MTLSLIVFLLLVVGVISTTSYFLRGTLQSLSLTAAEHAKIFALAYFKAAALISIAVLASFDETFRGLTREAANALPWWNWAILFFKPIGAGLAVVVAFLDQSATRARERADSIRAAKAASAPPFAPTNP